MSRSQSPIVRQSLAPALHCSVEDQRRLLAASPYFQSLTPVQIEDVQRRFSQQHYAAESPIYTAGTPATRLSIVAAGAVKVQRPTWEGKDILLDLLVPGDQFGSLAELGDPVYRDTAIAHTECCILSTTSGDFAQILAEFPPVALDTLTIVAARLREAQSAIEQLSAYPVEQRIARTLIHLAEKVGVQKDDALLIDVPLSRQDIADMTGTTVESASRVLSEFRRAGLIDSGRRWISILDHDALSNRVS